MRKVLIGIILLACVLFIKAQDIPFFAMDNTSVSGPSTIPGLAYWWVASDLVVSNTVTNWVDRIQGSVWTNGASASRPTNSTEGVYFSGSSWLTNSGLVYTTIDGTGPPVFFIIKRTAQPGIFGDILCNRTTSFGYKFNEFASYGTDDFVYDASTPTGLSPPFLKTNSWLTFIYSGRNGTWASYTNGVQAYTGSSGSVDRIATNCLATESVSVSARNLVGYIREIAIWTNTTLTSGNASFLNSYSTNTYGYTP